MPEKRTDLSKLLEACQQGDELAWEALVREHQGRVFGISYHYTGNREDARDLAQDIFVKIYERLDRCTEADLFLPWMIRVARNASIDYLRRKQARPPAGDIPAEEHRGLVFHGNNPEEASVTASRKRLFYRALQALTFLNREVILLKEVQGMSLEEVSSVVGVPLGTIKSRLHRARLELAEKVLSLTGKGSELAQSERGAQ